MKNIYGLLVLVVFFSGCQKDNFKIENLNNNQILVFGHGGMGIGQVYPINSYESIASCLNIGADGTELDVQMTKDSVLVAYHPEYLENSTNSTGKIYEKNWSQLKNISYNITPYTNYKLISLDELFDNLPEIHSFIFTFDCKLDTSLNNINSFCSTFANAINRIVEKYGLYDNLLIESEYPDFLKIMQNKSNNFQLFYYPKSFQQGLDKALNLGIKGITISTDMISKEQIEKAHEAGLFVTVWNTHSKNSNIDAINKNPDFIQTDKVKYLLKLLH